VTIKLVSAERGPIIPHGDFEDYDYCCCLFGLLRGDEAEIRCNECNSLIRIVPAPDLQRTLTEMELQGRRRQRDLSILSRRPSFVGIVATDRVCMRWMRERCEQDPPDTRNYAPTREYPRS